MAPQIIHLPDGQHFTVTPVFAGLFFKSHELNTHQNAFPVGWSIVIHTQDDDVEGATDSDEPGQGPPSRDPSLRKSQIHSFKKPTLQNDYLFISSTSAPSNSEFKPAASPTRQIALMLWTTLYWYFHQPEPEPRQSTTASKDTPAAGKPKGEWRINIKRDGVLRARNLIPKLERMGLIITLDSAVGTSTENDGEGWTEMFVSQRMFWQIPGRLFLFTLQPKTTKTHSVPGSPMSSRPTSPVGGGNMPGTMSPRPSSHHLTNSLQSTSSMHSTNSRLEADVPGGPHPMTIVTMPSFPVGPFYSSSHLPTYYPPAPAVYTTTDGVRHPVRPKPPRMGEVFYTRFVPSRRQYLSFRVASASPLPVPYLGPVSAEPPSGERHGHLATLSDTSLLQMWLASPRVAGFWGRYEPGFLAAALASRHSFPAVAMWDGVPFGYVELYWVREDALGRLVGRDADDWDRGAHVLVGEEWARGCVGAWLSSLVHWAFTADYRTNSFCMEPRVDNARFIQHLQFAGFTKEREIAFPHKQACFVRLRRDTWEGPVL